MMTLTPQEATPIAPAFDADMWLATFSALGGCYALIADRRLALVCNGPCATELRVMVARLGKSDGRYEAIRTAIEARQLGEVA